MQAIQALMSESNVMQSATRAPHEVIAEDPYLETMHANAEVFDFQTERLFRYLQVSFAPLFGSLLAVYDKHVRVICKETHSLFFLQCEMLCTQIAMQSMVVVQVTCIIRVSKHCVIVLHHCFLCSFSLLQVFSFSLLQVFTAAVFAFAHGSNDVANSIGPFATIYGIYKDGGVQSGAAVPIWTLVLGMSVSCVQCSYCSCGKVDVTTLYH